VGEVLLDPMRGKRGALYYERRGEERKRTSILAEREAEREKKKRRELGFGYRSDGKREEKGEMQEERAGGGESSRLPNGKRKGGEETTCACDPIREPKGAQPEKKGKSGSASVHAPRSKKGKEKRDTRYRLGLSEPQGEKRERDDEESSVQRRKKAESLRVQKKKSENLLQVWRGGTGIKGKAK